MAHYDGDLCGKKKRIHENWKQVEEEILALDPKEVTDCGSRGWVERLEE